MEAQTYKMIIIAVIVFVLIILQFQQQDEIKEQLMELEDFDFYVGDKLIQIHVGGKAEKVFKKQEFLSWCRREKRMKWCTKDESEWLGRTSGVFTDEQYWLYTRNSDIKEDMIVYMRKNGMIK